MKRIDPRWLGLLLTWTVLFLSSPCSAQTTAKKVATVEGITEYRLDNGLRYLLFPDASSPKVTINLTVFVGSRHEGYGETGMAHLLEHMLFKGSKLFPDVDRAMLKRGARFNGTTWVDRTNYYEIMQATDDNLDFALKMEADRLVNSFIRREDLAKEMTVVRNEFEQGENDPAGILSQRMMAVAFEWHNYGKSTIGNRTDIERVPIENLQAFYRKFYQPDNIMVVIAGKFNQKLAHQAMQKYFGALKSPKRELAKTYTEEPAQDGERTVILRRVGEVGVTGIIYHTPSAAHPDCAAVQVLAKVLTAAPSGRLYKALVEAKKATEVSGFAPAWHDPGVLEIQASVGPNSTPQEVRDITLNVLENLKKKPITKEEVERAKLQLLASWKQAFNRSSTVAIRLSEWAAAGDWRLFFLHRDRIKKMTPDHVNAVANKYLRTSNRTVGMFLPIPKGTQIARAEIPASPSVADLVKNYKGGEAVAKGEVFDPTPANIEKRVVRKRFKSGVKAAFLSKKTRGNSVVARLTLRFGNEKSLFDFQTEAAFLGTMMRRGTKKYDRQQLRDELAKLRAQLSVSGDLGELTVAIQAERDTLPAVLDILEEVLRRPSFPEQEFDILKRSAVQGIKQALVEPYYLASNQLSRKLNPFPKDDIRYVYSLTEQMKLLETTKLARVKQLYEEQLGATHGELAVVGDFDADVVFEKIDKMLAGWTSKVPYRRVVEIAQPNVRKATESIVTPDKKNAYFMAGYQMKMQSTDPQYPALVLANYILGSSGLKSLLFDRLRNEEGLCYGAGSSLTVSALDPHTSFSIRASCNPDVIDKVNKVTMEVLNAAKKNGIGTEHLEEYRKGFLRELNLQRSSDTALTALLRRNLYLDRTMYYYADLENKLKRLSNAEVNRALRQLIHPNRLVIIQAGDFRKNKK